MPPARPGFAADPLTDAWRLTLGRPPRGAESDFFAAGGDSLMIVRMVALLNSAGVTAEPADFLLGRTFDGILRRLHVRVAGPADASPAPQANSEQASTGPAGPVPILPAQFRWLECDFADPDHFALAWTFTVPRRTPDGQPVGADQISSALHALACRHEALRTRYLLQSYAAEVLAEPVPGLLSTVRLPASASEADVLAALGRCHREHELRAGRVLAATWLPAQRLLQVAVHHLAADGFSLSVLADQLEDELLGRPPAGRPTQPRGYADALAQWRDSASATADAQRWMDLDWPLARRVPAESDGPGRLASIEAETATLDGRRTGVLDEAAARMGCSFESLLLAAAGTAITAQFGLRAVSIDAYHHGRDGAPGGLDLASTIGYLQASYPVVILAGPDKGWPDRAGPQLGRVPAARFGFDALRFAGNERLAGLPSSGVRLNFRGRISDINSRQHCWLRPAQVPIGGRRSARQVETDLLMMQADRLADGLALMVAYSTDRFRTETIRTLVERIMALLALEAR